MIKNNLILLSLILLCISCGNPDPSPQSITQNTGGEGSAAIENQTQNHVASVAKTNTYDIEAAKKAIEAYSFGEKKSVHGQVTFAAVTNGQTYLYVASKTAGSDLSGRYNKTDGQPYGLIDGNDQIIIPLKYDWLYNIDDVASGYIVASKGGKLGMLNLQGKEILETVWDAIYPGDLSLGVLAQVKQGNRYGWVDENGKVSFDAKDGKWNLRPSTASLVNNWKARRAAKAICPLACMGDMEEIDKGNLLPAHISQIFDLPDFVELSTEYSGADIKIEKPSSGFSAFISTFSYVSGVRGDMTHEQSIVVESSTGNVSKSKNTFYQQAKTQMLADGLFEIRLPEGASYGYAETLTMGPLYEYVKVDGNGNIQEMRSDREFPCTQFVKMDESYFQIEHRRNLTRNGTFEGGDEVAYYKHSPIDVLDYMRNEIFASYGYRFKKEKWQEIFGAKKWYSARLDNVDHQLTEIDNHNIKLLKEMKKKMEGKEMEYTKERKEIYHPAG